MAKYRDYLCGRYRWAKRGVWGKAESFAGFVGVVCCIYRWFKPAQGEDAVTAFWLGVIPLVAGFSIFGVRWVMSSFELYKRLKRQLASALKSAEIREAKLKEEARSEIEAYKDVAISLRNENQRLQLKAVEEAKVDTIANQYLSLFKEEGEPVDPVARVKIMLRSGLLSLRGIEDALPLFEQKLTSRLVSNPFGGSEEPNDGPDHVEKPYWNVRIFWQFLDLAAKYNLFIEDPNSNWLLRYWNIPENERPSEPIIIKGDEVAIRILEEGRWDEPNQPSVSEAAERSSEEPETPVSTPRQA